MARRLTWSEQGLNDLEATASYIRRHGFQMDVLIELAGEAVTRTGGAPSRYRFAFAFLSTCSRYRAMSSRGLISCERRRSGIASA